MKIGIYTYYNVHNHGALLQAFALKQVVSSLTRKDSPSVNFITFERDYSFVSFYQKGKYKISVSSIKFYFQYLFKNGLRSFFFNLKKKRLLDNFKHNNFDFINETSKCDLCICGSDEVFSTEIGFNKCMYSIDIDVPFISYAASFGPTNYDELVAKNLDGKIKEGLCKFKSISVRDENSLNLIKRLTGRDDVLITCDPVLLYGYSKELEQATRVNENFVLVYSYDKNLNDENEYKKILEFAHKKGLKVYSVGFYHKWADKSINVDPINIFSYFKSAKCVITDTFHGGVLSLVSNRQFVAMIRNNGNKVNYLLKQHNLSSRIISNLDDLESAFENKIEYNSVNKIIERNREESYNFLRKVIK